jgi:hypothetical protein
LRQDAIIEGGDQPKGYTAMLNHHIALAAIHLAMTAILYAHGAVAEALCVLIVSTIYANMPRIH